MDVSLFSSSTDVCLFEDCQTHRFMLSRYPQSQLVEVNAHSLFSKWFSESGKLVCSPLSTLLMNMSALFKLNFDLDHAVLPMLNILLISGCKAIPKTSRDGRGGNKSGICFDW